MWCARAAFLMEEEGKIRQYLQEGPSRDEEASPKSSDPNSEQGEPAHLDFRNPTKWITFIFLSPCSWLHTTASLILAVMICASR